MADYNRVEDDLESSTNSTTTKNGLKVILLGKSGVGKSTLYLRIRDNKFYKDVGDLRLDNFKKTIALDNNRSVEMQLFDTANMEWHERTLTRTYYHGSRVALILYSTEEMESVDELKSCIQAVLNDATHAKRFLIRNKIDLPTEDQSVPEDEVEAKLRKAGYSFESNCKYSISCKTGEGIQDLIQAIGQVLIKQPARHDSQQCSLQSYHKPKQTEQSRKCCSII